MPLHFGKIFVFIALLTAIAFVLWQLWIAIFAGVAFSKRTQTQQGEAPSAITLPLG